MSRAQWELGRKKLHFSTTMTWNVASVTGKWRQDEQYLWTASLNKIALPIESLAERECPVFMATQF